MLTISFIFRPGTYDEDFRRLDAATQVVAEATEGTPARRAGGRTTAPSATPSATGDDRSHRSEFARAVPHRAAKTSYDHRTTATRSLSTEMRSAYRLVELTGKARAPKG